MNNYVITIARGYGSGGKSIGKELAKKLGIVCYDREILQMASDESGINESLFYKIDERIKPSLFKRSGVCTGKIIPPEDSSFVSDENLINYEAKIIQDIARENSCVIIGRAADYILRTYPNVVSINIQAPFDVCVSEISKRMSLSTKEAEKKITAIDKYRADFYHYCTGQKWNDPANYDLSINTAKLGYDKTIQTIIDFAEIKLGFKISE